MLPSLGPLFSVYRFKYFAGRWSQQPCFLAKFSTISSADNGDDFKPFASIPGPKSYPLIGNLWRYLPVIGHYDLQQMDRNGRYNLERYGKIVREEINQKHKILHLFDPKDMESMFRQTDRCPYRRSHRALLKYRVERPDKYQSGGIFPENGAEWARLRDLFKHYFLIANNINQYDGKLNEIAMDLVDYVRHTRDPNTMEIEDFQQHLYRWSLESICSIMLDDRLGCLRPDNDPDSGQDVIKMIQAGHNTTYAVMRTELYSTWEQKPTADYRLLVDAQDSMAGVVEKYLAKRSQQIQNERNPQTILGKMILDPKISSKDLFGIVMDFVLAGIDTTSYTAGFELYFLAKHPDVQEKLRDEILKSNNSDCDDNDDDGGDYFQAEHFHRTPLLKACLKETLRLRPVSIGVGRFATTDLYIGGYHIPKSTTIITQNQVSCQSEEYFPEAPNKFRPERWMMSGNTSTKRKELSAENRFLYIPFGHGTRMCMGRRIAELEMHILVANLLKHFHIKYDYDDDIGQKTRLINTPDRPLRLKFVDRF